MTGALAALAGVFGTLSLLAVGGIPSTLPEMQRQVVAVHHWMGPQDFAALFALAQASPGPNMLISTLVGWRVAGLPGALVATVALCGPSSLLTYATAHLWHRFRHAPWRQAVQAGLTPVTVGLVLGAAFLLARATTTGWSTALITGATTVLLLRTRIHPLWLLGGAAALGAMGWA